MSIDETKPRPGRAVVIGEGVTWLSRWTLRWIVVAVGAVLLGLLFGRLWSILLPVILALILTTVLQPPARFLERRLRFPAALASASVILLTLGLVALAVAVLAPSVQTQAADLADKASGGLGEIQDWLADSSLHITEAQVSTAVEAVQARLQSSASSIASGVLIGVSAVTSALVNVLLTLVLSFFFLKDGRRFLPWVRELSGPRVGVHLSEVGTRAWATLGGFIRTQALVGLIDAVLIGTGLVVLGVPLALPLAVLTFIGAFAPIIGAVTVGALAVLVALVSNGLATAVIVLVIVLLVQQLEGNVLLPYLQGKSLDLHAAVVLLTVVLGSTLFGVAGAFLSVPTVAVAAVVLRYVNGVIRERAGEDVTVEPPPPAELPTGDAEADVEAGTAAARGQGLSDEDPPPPPTRR